MFEEADREINFESSRSLIRLFEMRVRKIRKKKKNTYGFKQFVSPFHGINEKINLLLLDFKLLIKTKPIQMFEILFLNIFYIFDIEQ